MKRNFLFVCMLLFVCSSASAQDFRTTFGQDFPTNRGSKMISAQFSYSSAGGDLYERNGNRLSIFQVNHSYSSFVTSGLAFGLHFSLVSIWQDGNTQSSFGVGPQLLCFLRGNRSKPNVKGANCPYLSVAFTYTHFSGGVDGNIISLGIGNVHMLTRTVGLSTEATYGIENLESVSGNSFNLKGGIVAFLY